MSTKDRKQVPVSFNLNDPQEREMVEWLERLRSQGKSKKGNMSAVIKKILFVYIEREKEREAIRQKLLILDREEQLRADKTSKQSATSASDNLNHSQTEDDMEIDADSLPF